MYYTYIIESLSTGRWYYGHSVNPEKRLHEHNTGQAASTRNKGPWRLIFKREFPAKLAANRFELYLKRMRNKAYIRKEYSAYFLEVAPAE